MPFGQLVIGPPGSGKTTYCNGMHQYLTAVGRKTAIVNLDPANDVLPYTPAIDVADLVDLEAVMDDLHLGPNGGLLYCMDYLHENLDWLQEKLKPLLDEGYYLIFDCPGQVELFMMHGTFRSIVGTLQQQWHIRLTAVHLVDGHLCTDPTKYVSGLLLSLSTMLHLELPHVNVLSKIDLIHQYGDLGMRLSFFTRAQDLSCLVQLMGDNPWTERHRKLTESICEVVEDFGLVSFVPLSIQEKESLQAVLSVVDKANGCAFASLAGKDPYPAEFVYGSGLATSDTDIWDKLHEKYEHGGKGQRLPDIVEHAEPADSQEPDSEQPDSE